MTNPTGAASGMDRVPPIGSDIYTIAQFVGLSGDQATRFVGVLNACGYVVCAAENGTTYAKAEKIALRAINDYDSRGMVGHGRNHLHQRVARAILHASLAAAAQPLADKEEGK